MRSLFTTNSQIDLTTIDINSLPCFQFVVRWTKHANFRFCRYFKSTKKSIFHSDKTKVWEIENSIFQIKIIFLRTIGCRCQFGTAISCKWKHCPNDANRQICHSCSHAWIDNTSMSYVSWQTYLSKNANSKRNHMMSDFFV